MAPRAPAIEIHARQREPWRPDDWTGLPETVRYLVVPVDLRADGPHSGGAPLSADLSSGPMLHFLAEGGSPQGAAALVQWIEANGLAGRIMLSSPSVRLLAALRRLHPLPLGLRLAGGMLDRARRLAAPALGCAGFVVDHGRMDAELVRKAHLSGYGIIIDEVDDEARLRSCVAARANGVMSSQPHQVHQLLSALTQPPAPPVGGEALTGRSG